ncbi:MAG: hypothetical protein V3T21_02110 [Candidatus Margulisiibacteriota bacterium]
MSKNIGQLPPSGGKIALGRVFPMRRYFVSNRNEFQESRYREGMSIINRDHRLDLSGIARYMSTKSLTAFIEKEIKGLFSPSRIEFLPKHGATPFSHLREIALTRNLWVYVPGKNPDDIYIPGENPFEILAVKPDQLGITPEDLPAEYERIAVLPLISGLGQKRALDEYPRHGALVVVPSPDKMFDPLVDLPLLSLIANNTAVILHQNNLKIT